MIGLGKGRARRARPLPTQWQEECCYGHRPRRLSGALRCRHGNGDLPGLLSAPGAEEYAPILRVLTAAADAQPATLTLDLRTLQFLNSSGINTLAKFVLHARQDHATRVVMKGSHHFPWQEKSLKNFQRLLPGLQLEIE